MSIIIQHTDNIIDELFQTVSVDYWQPLEELLQCSRIQQRAITDFNENYIEDHLCSVDLSLLSTSDRSCIKHIIVEITIHMYVLDDKFHYIMQIQSTSLHNCPRCRLQTSEQENELCRRCSAHLLASDRP
jgi:hypothetical protein